MIDEVLLFNSLYRLRHFSKFKMLFLVLNFPIKKKEEENQHRFSRSTRPAKKRYKRKKKPKNY